MCEIYHGDVYGPQLWHEWYPTARKEHTCSACDGLITKGQRYKRISCLFEGAWDDYKVCPGCIYDMDAFMKAHRCGTNPELFVEDLEMCIRAEPETSQRWRGMLARMNRRKEARTNV